MKNNSENNGSFLIHSDMSENADGNICPSCGSKVGKNYTFCNLCGATINADRKKICKKCGTELPQNSTFCFCCGEKIIVRKLKKAKSTGKNRSATKKAFVAVGIALAVAVLVAVIIYMVFPHADFFGNREKALQDKQVQFETEVYRAEIDAYMVTVEEFYSEISSADRHFKSLNEEIEMYLDELEHYHAHSDEYEDALSNVYISERTTVSRIKETKRSIRRMYDSLKTPPDKDDERLSKIKDAVVDAYGAYEDLYDLLFSPSSNIYDWQNDRSKLTDEYLHYVGELKDTLDEVCGDK